MQPRHSVHVMQKSQEGPRALLTAREVQRLLHIDRSTVYRMAEDGRLPAIRVGRSWRFPAEPIEALLGQGDAPESDMAPVDPVAGPAAPRSGDAALPQQGVHDGALAAGAAPAHPSGPTPEPVDAGPVSTAAATAAVEVAADLLGVMMVVTDMHGRPLTEVAHPCPWFVQNADDPDVLDRCVAEWHDLADHPDLTPQFQPGALGFECARAFIRRGSTLVGMVLAGGVSPEPSGDVDPDLYHLDEAARQRVLAALPRIAATISTTSPRPTSTPAPLTADAPRTTP
jgi:excisionase family DNA binding protein